MPVNHNKSAVKSTTHLTLSVGLTKGSLFTKNRQAALAVSYVKADGKTTLRLSQKAKHIPVKNVLRTCHQPNDFIACMECESVSQSLNFPTDIG